MQGSTQHGFTHTRIGAIHYFTHKGLGFQLKLYPSGAGEFYLKSKRRVVKYPPPDKKLLGEKYQPQVSALGYGIPPWYANALHELLHVWYCLHTKGKLSPNHARLLGITKTSTKVCDMEELQVTTLQLYANVSLMYALLSNTHDNKCVRQARQFQRWIAACVTSNSLNNERGSL